MGKSEFQQRLIRAKGMYMDAKMAEEASEKERAKDLYLQAQQAYEDLAEMYRNGLDNQQSSEEVMMIMAESCNKRAELLDLKAELLDTTLFAKKESERVQCHGFDNDVNITKDQEYFVLSMDTMNKEKEQNPGIPIEEYENIKGKLEVMSDKMKKLLNSIVQSVENLEAVYARDIKKVKKQNPVEAHMFNLKRFETSFSSMKKYINKVIEASNNSFQSEISLMTSSIRSSTIWDKALTALKKDEKEPGLPLGFTVEELGIVFKEIDPPYFVPHSKLVHYQNELHKAKNKLKKKDDKLEKTESKLAIMKGKLDSEIKERERLQTLLDI